MSKRFTHDGVVIVDHLKKDLIYIDGDENLLSLAEYVVILQYENEQLKKEKEADAKCYGILLKKYDKLKVETEKLNKCVDTLKDELIRTKVLLSHMEDKYAELLKLVHDCEEKND